MNSELLAQMRLEALKLAMQTVPGQRPNVVLEVAKQYEGFVVFGATPKQQ